MHQRLLALLLSCDLVVLGAAALGCGDGQIDDNAAPSRPVGIAGTAQAGAGGTQLSGAGSGGAASSEAGAGGMPASGGAASGGASGSAGSGAAGRAELDPSLFCDAPHKVLMVSCGVGSCHANKDTEIGDFAHSPESIYAYVNVPSVRHADCGLIIDSSNYGNSFILRKVRGEFEVPRCGERMPVGSFKITEEQIDCLASWLQQFQL